MTAAPHNPAFDPTQVHFVTRGVTPAEAAAVTAVLGGLLREEADHLRRKPQPSRSAWQLSQRSLRGPLTPGEGRWRGFS
jgi:hypothetical protein